MARLTDKAIRMAFGTANPGLAGRLRVMKGIRDNESRDLYVGLGLLAISYLSRTRARKELLYRREVSAGAALVIHNKGDGRLEIIKNGKRKS